MVYCANTRIPRMDSSHLSLYIHQYLLSIYLFHHLSLYICNIISMDCYDYSFYFWWNEHIYISLAPRIFSFALELFHSFCMTHYCRIDTLTIATQLVMHADFDEHNQQQAMNQIFIISKLYSNESMYQPIVCDSPDIKRVSNFLFKSFFFIWFISTLFPIWFFPYI